MCGYDDVREMRLAAIRKLNGLGIPCVVLSKGRFPSELADCEMSNTYGITMVSADESYREAYEPGAAPYEERVSSLLALHSAGYRTWMSMEPYPTPNIHEQELIPLLEKIGFVDRIIFGRTNYNKAVSSYPKSKEWYNDCVRQVVSFCRSRGIECYIKKGTWTGGPGSSAAYCTLSRE